MYRALLLLIFMSTVKADLEFPSCIGNSVCGFLQANAKGVSKIPLCNCTTTSECPMNWDPYDGKSITQSASDQYKFCDSAPEELPICNPQSQTASYTSLQYYGRENGLKLVLKDQIHCLCPDGYNYLDTRYKFLTEAFYDVAIIKYYCLPLKKCLLNEICKEVTDIPGEYLVNPKCQCPRDHSCPTVSPKHVETVQYDQQTIVHNVRCQNTLPDTIQTWGQIRRREPLSSEDNSMYFYAQN